jgi:hypothetical protein
MMTWDNATPIKDPRVAQLRSAALYANEVHFDRKADYLVKGWLGSEAVSVVYGDSNCGKSFFGLDVSAHVASGKPWMGHNVKKGKVLYLACEGGVKSYSPRIEAIRNAKSDLYDAGMADHFLLLPTPVDLHGEKDVNAISAAMPDLDFSLIVVDTLAMSMGGGSENDSADMGQYIQNIFELKARHNCHVMIIHHSGKDKTKGSRGHSSLRAAVDTEIQVSDEGIYRTATCKKQRNMENGKQVAFTLRGVDLGLDDENDPITSCVVELADVDLTSLKKSRAIKGNTLIAKQALDEAIAKHGRRMADAEKYPASRDVVEIDIWRSEFLKMRIDSGAQEASVVRDFTRQSKKLQEDGIVHSYSGMVWFVHDEDRQDI